MNYKQVLVNTYRNNKIELVPITLSDDWTVSSAYVIGDYIHLKNASDGREIAVKLSELTHNHMGKIASSCIAKPKMSNKVNHY